MKALIRIYRTVRNMLATEAEALAVMEETLSRAAGRASLPDMPKELLLYRLAIESSLERMSTGSPQGPVEALLPRFDEGGHLTWPFSFEKAVTGRSDLELPIRDALDRLDAIDRAAFVLREIEELSLEDVGAVLGLSTVMIRERTHRARLIVMGVLAGCAEGMTLSPS
jgi:DNA-directed RNA polymerase specialized sigma24 family protein